MKANEAPEKIYFDGESNACKLPVFSSCNIEYTRTDILIEKACEFLKDHMDGYDICEDDIERSVESFKLAMKL